MLGSVDFADQTLAVQLRFHARSRSVRLRGRQSRLVSNDKLTSRAWIFIHAIENAEPKRALIFIFVPF